MGTRKNRVFALLIAVVMILTSAIGVFAAEPTSSVTQGAQPTAADTPFSTEIHSKAGTIDVPAGSTVTVDGQPVTVNGTVASGIPEGSLVVVKSADGKFVDYRWMKTGKIKKAAKKKLTWKKVKGANYYLVQVTKKGKTYFRLIKGTKATAKKLKLKTLKGAKFRVRPVKLVNGTPYLGGLSKVKKGKK